MVKHSQTYDLSCMLLHVREPNPFINDKTNEFFNKSFMLNDLLMILLDHFNDYGIICKNTFTTLNIFSKINDNKSKLFNLMMNIVKRRYEADPNIKIITFNKKET